MNSKVSLQHRQKPAYIYVRQSTMNQVLHHQESTQRQYALREKAISLGWPSTSIRVLDRDLGQSGSHTTGREDFKSLVADVSMGLVGAVFALEASRLARSCADWHRLIELCSLSGTLLVDEDGLYDPSDFNDRLVLGMKGTMSQAELHFLHARLHGGRRNKAERGELRIPLPIGMCHDEQSRIVFDPDVQVREVVALLFRTFRELGSANAVVVRFAREGLQFPKRVHGGVWKGKLLWGPLDLQRVLSAINNAIYAGVYVYGRKRCVKKIDEGGEIRSRMQRVPQSDWLVEIRDHHPGFLSYEEYLQNRDRLQRNRSTTAALPGPVREGKAMLHGLLICGICGRRATVRYKSQGGIQPSYQCYGQRYGDAEAQKCLQVRGDLLDCAVTERSLSILKEENLGLALEAFDELQNRQQSVDRQWQLKVERAQYEADLAQRRYEEVDPTNRLVAASLEARWNEALICVVELRQQSAAVHGRKAMTISPRQRAQILALAEDLPRLWQAPTTSAKDKKRILRLLIKDITVEKKVGVKHATLHIRWQGGALEQLLIPIPPGTRLHYPKELLTRVESMAEKYTDSEIADIFNQEGLKTPHGKSFSAKRIRMTRHHFEIPGPVQKRPDELTVPEVAARFSVSRGVVYHWIELGLLPARRAGKRSRYWVTLQPSVEAVLRQYIRESIKLPMSRDPIPTTATKGAV